MHPTEQLSDAKRRLLEKLLRGEHARQSWEAPIEPYPPGAVIPLAPSQQQVWLSAQMTSMLPVYNEPITVHYRGRLDMKTFERAFQEVLRRHEIWRTSFVNLDGQITQAVLDFKLAIPLTDLTALPEDGRTEEADRIATEDARLPFDLGAGPLLRARMLKLSEEYYRLNLTLHHIIFDGVSIYRILVPELAAIYRAFLEGRPSPLPEPLLQYGDYALWHRRLLSGDFVQRETQYWRKQLGGPLPNLELPTDRPRPAVRSHRGNMTTFSISGELTAALKRVSRAEGVTLHMFMLAAFKTLLHRYSGQEDIMVGGVTDGRRRPEFEQLMGYFLSIVVLRTRPKAEITFREYLAEVKHAVIEALSHSEVPFDRLVQELQPKRDPSRHPFFQVSFSIEAPAAPSDAHWDATQMDIVSGATKLDLYLEIDERPEGYVGRFVYSTDLFDAHTIDRMIGHWKMLLEALAANPAVRLCDLPLLTTQEEHDLRFTWNDTHHEVPRATIHQLFEQQVERTPDAIAVEAGTRRLTYRQLNERANRLARRLREAGVGRDTMVGLCVERSVDVVAAPLAVLKSGGAYLPLDPAFPRERLAFLMEDAQPALVVTEPSLEDRLPLAGVRVLYCGESDGSGSNPDPMTQPEDLAYVLYTSGSTGRPKGVEIPHAAVVNFLLSMQREPGFTAADSLLAVTTLSFDIAALELYLPIITGGRLIVASRDATRDPDRLMDLIEESRCTVLQATPVAWRALVDAGWSGSSGLKILCGGEALARDLAQHLLSRCRELWNLYGPTETTIWSTIHRVTPGTGPVPIGHPIANTEILILDAHRRLAPVGVPGELCIGGAGVARGYLHREELTAERFIPHPGKPETRVYRTGDLARWRADGTIECLGRVDNQVKIRGFRIEPEEIESALLEHPDLRAAAVRTWPDASGGMSLVAYAVSRGQNPDLRPYLKQKLPDYMLPSRFVFVEALPLTPNGKVDRKALPKPVSVETALQFVAPRSSVEKRLAAVWESVLDIRPIGVRDDFFDLGGHSFLVAKLLRRIDLEFGKKLSMANVFHAPTIEQLALQLTDHAFIDRHRRNVNAPAAGPRSSLLWLYAGATCRALASRLAPDRALISVALPPADEEKVSKSCTMQEVAARMVREVRSLQPEGPYFLAGWCAAGIIAYEVAAQLVAAGQDVATLVLVESSNPAVYFKIPARQIHAAALEYHLKKLYRLPARKAWHYAFQRIKDLLKPPPSSQELQSFSSKIHQAVLAYNPPAYPGRVSLIRSLNRPRVPSLDLGWPDLVHGSFEVREVPGDHVSMFAEPHVDELAAHIRACLREADAWATGQQPLEKLGA